MYVCLHLFMLQYEMSKRAWGYGSGGATQHNKLSLICAITISDFIRKRKRRRGAFLRTSLYKKTVSFGSRHSVTVYLKNPTNTPQTWRRWVKMLLFNLIAIMSPLVCSKCNNKHRKCCARCCFIFILTQQVVFVQLFKLHTINILNTQINCFDHN